jgi:hypothetical protein
MILYCIKNQLFVAFIIDVVVNCFSYHIGTVFSNLSTMEVGYVNPRVKIGIITISPHQIATFIPLMRNYFCSGSLSFINVGSVSKSS